MEQQIHKLSDLNIPKDETNMFFNCPQEKQSNLVNRTFLVCDYREGVETRFSRQGGEKKGKTLVFIKFHANDPESESRKFFTGSKDILYNISAGTVDYTDGEDRRPNLLKGHSSVKSEAHESLVRG